MQATMLSDMQTQGENVFLADLHHPGGDHEAIDTLLSGLPADTKRIFLLGDCFHFWVNDESFIQSQYQSFLERLRQFTREGIQLFFMEGNRDFLASHYFDEQPWIDVLPNPTVLELGGRAVYLGHGDELCWNDWAYQSYKTVIRSLPLRWAANHIPAPLRRKIANRMSEASASIVAGKTEKTLQVPEKAYRQVAQTGVDAIVHGHLHSTYQHQLTLEDRTTQIFCFGWIDGKRNFIHFKG